MTKEEILKKLATDIRLRGMSEGTVKEYSAKAIAFMNHFNKPADELGEKEFRLFLEYLDRERNIAPATFNFYNTSLRFLFEITLERNLNYRRLPRKKLPIKVSNVLTKEEVLGLLEAIDDDLRYKTILSLIYGSGLRSSEAAKLRIQDIDSQKMCLVIHQSKRHKDRYVPLAPSSLELLREYFKAYRPKHPLGYLFLNKDGSNHITAHAIWDALKKYHARAGIETPASVHTLRHSYTMHLLDAGVDPFRIQKLLGHSSIATTIRYLRINDTEILNTPSPLESLFEND